MRTWQDKTDNAAPADIGILSAAEDNARGKEMNNAVTTAGLSLDPVTGPDTNFFMLAQAMARYSTGGVMGVDTGAANAHVVGTIGSFKVPTSFFDGMVVMFYAAATNTGAVTLNAWGLGAKPLYDDTGAACAGGEIVGARMIVAVYGAALNSGAGAYKLTPWSNALNYGGGGGGGGDPLTNIGSGDGEVFKQNFAGYNELRTIDGTNGIVVANNGNVIEVDGSALESKAGRKPFFSVDGGSKTVADNTVGTITSYGTPVDDLGDSTYSAGVVTIGADDAGVWLIGAGAQITSGDTARNLRISIQVNGTAYASSRDGSGTTDSAKAVVTSYTAALVAGDDVAVEVLQTNGDGTSRPVIGVYFWMTRLGG